MSDSRIRSYKDLQVWKKAVALVTEVYRETRSFPKEEVYALTSQIRRSASSVPANIAEGWGRGKTKEFCQFLRIARGSLLELETHLIVAGNLGYGSDVENQRLATQIEEVSKMLNALVAKLDGRSRD
jgi:four helix bundle protein